MNDSPIMTTPQDNLSPDAGPGFAPKEIKQPDTVATPDGGAFQSHKEDTAAFQAKDTQQTSARLSRARGLLSGLIYHPKQGEEFAGTEKHPEHRGTVKRPSSEKVVKRLEMFAKQLFDIQPAQGLENYDKVLKNYDGHNVVFVASHVRSDAEMPLIISELAKQWDIVTANHSTHHDPKKNPMANLGMRILGKEKFSPINQTVAGDNSATPIRRDNFTQLAARINNGTGEAVVIAGNSPVYDGVLPDKPGIGPVVLGQLLENAVFVPVVADIQTDRPFAKGDELIGTLVQDRLRFGKRKATIKIGEPYTLPKIDVTPFFDRTDPKAVSQTNDKLRELGGINMQHLAALMPEAQRGKWGEGQTTAETSSVTSSQPTK